MEKVFQILSALDSAEQAEVADAWSGGMIWNEIGLMTPEEVGRALCAMNSAICLLDLSPPWVVKAIRKVTCS